LTQALLVRERIKDDLAENGMTYGDVLAGIERLAVEHHDRLVGELIDQDRSAKLAEASRLADELGFELVKKGGTAS